MLHKNADRISEYEFSIGVRLTHWIRFVAITLLVVSGYYISYGLCEPRDHERTYKFYASKVGVWRTKSLAFVLIAAFIFKFYLFIF